jgi:hypothetical protein
VTYVPEPPQQPGHPVDAYYPAPPYQADRPKNLTALGVLAFASAALFTLFTVGVAVVAERAVRHASTVDTDLDWSVAVYSLGVFLGLLAMVGAYVTASMWLFRARKNAGLLAPGTYFDRSPGWAWGGWVCPIVNLWFPYQVVHDTHRAVSPRTTSSLIGWWWTFFLVGHFSLRFARSVESGGTAANASNAQGLEIFASVTLAAALVLWGLVIRRVTMEQHATMYGPR